MAPTRGRIASPPPSLVLAHPRLRASEHRETDVSAHDQLLAVVGELHRCAVRSAFLRIEDLAAAPLVAHPFHVAQDFHTEDRLAVAIVGALGAHAVLRSGVDEDLSYDAHELAVHFADLYHTHG